MDAAWDRLQTPQIGETLPAFQGLYLRQVEVDEQMGSPSEIMWDTLSKFMNGSIYFKIEDSRGYISFYRLVTSYALCMRMRTRYHPAHSMTYPMRPLFRRPKWIQQILIYVSPQLSLTKLIMTLEIIKSIDFGSTAMELCDFPLPFPFSTVSYTSI